MQSVYSIAPTDSAGESMDWSLSQSEMQTDSSRIWAPIVEPNFYDNECYIEMMDRHSET